MFSSTILLVPGLGNSDDNHWQSYWEKKHFFPRVHQDNWEGPMCSEWVKTLDETISKFGPADVILVGHSLACATIGWWQAASGRKIKAALLVAPADTEARGFPDKATGFAPMPIQKLPFPTIVVASTNDEYVSLERAKYFANCWGSKFINIGAVGHINSAANLQDWPEGLELLKLLDRKV